MLAKEAKTSPTHLWKQAPLCARSRGLQVKSHWSSSVMTPSPRKRVRPETLLPLAQHFWDASTMNCCCPKSLASRREKWAEGQHCQRYVNREERPKPRGRHTYKGSHLHTAAASNKNRLLGDWKWAACLAWGLVGKCTAWVLLPVQLVVKVVDWRSFVVSSLLSAPSKMLTKFSVCKINEFKFHVSKNPSRNCKALTKDNQMSNKCDRQIGHLRTSDF